MVVHIAEACYLQLSSWTIKLTPWSLLSPPRPVLTALLCPGFILSSSFVLSFLSILTYLLLHVISFYSVSFLLLSLPFARCLFFLLHFNIFSTFSFVFLLFILSLPLFSFAISLFFLFFFTLSSLSLPLSLSQFTILFPLSLLFCWEGAEPDHEARKGPGPLASDGGEQQTCMTLFHTVESVKSNHSLVNIVIYWLIQPHKQEQWRLQSLLLLFMPCLLITSYSAAHAVGVYNVRLCFTFLCSEYTLSILRFNWLRGKKPRLLWFLVNAAK